MISTSTTKQNILWRWIAGGVIALTALVTIFAASTSVFAGGPANRPVFKSANPADYVVFNAITDNPEHGDERNFVLIREAGKGKFTNEVKLQPGKEYEVYSYFHNDAKSRLNTKENDGVGIARNVRMSADVPTVVRPGERGKISTSITADNANPKKVWDEAYVTAEEAVALRYVPDSAKVHSGGAVNGRTMSSDLFSQNGAYLGYDKLNGILPGCADYAGYVIYRLKVDQPQFTVSKKVASHESNKWGESLSLKPSETVDFQVTYKNTGTTDQNDVVLKDVIPKGMTYIKGSTSIVNAQNPDGLKLSDKIVSDQGINIGSYGPGASAVVTFSAKLADNKSYDSCDAATLVNRVSVITKNGEKSDSAKVVVKVHCASNECKPGVPEGDERCESAGTVPEELPHTGPAEMIAGVLGVAMVSLGVAYWIRSRQEYRKALAGHGLDIEPLEGTLGAAAASSETVDQSDSLEVTPQDRGQDAHDLHKR